MGSKILVEIPEYPYMSDAKGIGFDPNNSRAPWFIVGKVMSSAYPTATKLRYQLRNAFNCAGAEKYVKELLQKSGQNEDAQKPILVSRKEYDATIPWSMDQKAAMSKVKRTASIDGFAYQPKDDAEAAMIRKLFNNNEDATMAACSVCGSTIPNNALGIAGEDGKRKCKKCENECMNNNESSRAGKLLLAVSEDSRAELEAKTSSKNYAMDSDAHSKSKNEEESKPYSGYSKAHLKQAIRDHEEAISKLQAKHDKSPASNSSIDHHKSSIAKLKDALSRANPYNQNEADSSIDTEHAEDELEKDCVDLEEPINGKEVPYKSILKTKEYEPKEAPMNMASRVLKTLGEADAGRKKLGQKEMTKRAEAGKEEKEDK
jgi:hypothetical protein